MGGKSGITLDSTSRSSIDLSADRDSSIGDFSIRENKVEKPRSEKTSYLGQFKEWVSNVGTKISNFLFGSPTENATKKYDTAFGKLVNDIKDNKLSLSTLKRFDIMLENAELSGKDPKTSLTEAMTGSADLFTAYEKADHQDLAYKLKLEVREEFRGLDNSDGDWGAFNGQKISTEGRTENSKTWENKAEQFASMLDDIYKDAHVKHFGFGVGEF